MKGRWFANSRKTTAIRHFFEQHHAGYSWSICKRLRFGNAIGRKSRGRRCKLCERIIDEAVAIALARAKLEAWVA